MKHLKDFFQKPKTPQQRQYEAVRAIVMDELSAEESAKKFGYKLSTMSALLRRAKRGKLQFFPEDSKRKKSKKLKGAFQKEVVRMRNSGMSAMDISRKLIVNNASVSARTIERLLRDLGFPKLSRRTNKELGITRKNTIIPETSSHLDFSEIKPFSIDTPVAGVFFLLPYIIESGIVDIVEKCNLPKSSMIGAEQACLSMLLLKLIGQERLSHIRQFDLEPGLGIFAGLNMLPKPTYMNTYSCRCSEEKLEKLQKESITKFRSVNPELYNSGTVNLDFHSIPHFGDESEMEKVWCGARGKSIKGANTVFAQDAASNAIMYARADILRKEEYLEVKRFIEYWKKISGESNDTLVFDCKFTTYGILDELTDEGVKFITLRKRNASLLKATSGIPKENWKRLYLPIPKRKRKHVSVTEQEVKLRNCKNTFRQIIVKDHGRTNPTYIVSNDFERPLKEILIVYAKRWHVEQKLAEMVSFFNLNALSSPLMIRIHFDIFWTVVADTLYRNLAADLRRFENCLAPTLFKRFINMPGKIVFDGKNFQVHIRKRSHTPVLMGVKKLQKPFAVPWLDNRTVTIIWRA